MLTPIVRIKFGFLKKQIHLCLLTIAVLMVGCNKSRGNNENSPSVFWGANLPFNNFKNLNWPGSFDLKIPGNKEFEDIITFEKFTPTTPNTPLIWLRIFGDGPSNTNDTDFVWVPHLNGRFRPLQATKSLFEHFKVNNMNMFTNQPINERDLVLISNVSTKAFPITFSDLKKGTVPREDAAELPVNSRVVATRSPANYSHASMSGADFRNRDLTNAKFWGTWLPNADFAGANLQSADFHGAHLFEANFQGARLAGTGFKRAVLVKANLAGLDLAGLNFEYANLRGANLEGANLRGANLWGAELDNANLKGADLTGADLGFVSLYGTELKGAQVDRLLVISWWCRLKSAP